MTFLTAVIANLMSAAIGAALAFSYERWLKVRRARIARWFWNRAGASSVQLHLGSRTNLLPNEKEERFLTVSDAEVLGRVSGVLEEFFAEILLVHHADEIDWTKPVVSVGGGNINQVFQNIDISSFPEFRFDSQDHYTITNRDGSQRSTSKPPTSGEVSSSYGIIGRYGVKADGFRTELITIAGAYGPSTLRSLVHVLDKRNLREIFDDAESATSFQALIRVVCHEDSQYTTELSSIQALESLDKSLIVEAQPRPDVPRETANAARNRLPAPQANPPQNDETNNN